MGKKDDPAFPMPGQGVGRCPLCKRDGAPMSDHHLVPKSRGGKITEPICNACHKQIHALYDNKLLETELNTVESLLAEPQFQKYLAWIRKQPPGRKFKTKRSKKTRKRGRRG